jgi:hypothetical protein
MDNLLHERIAKRIRTETRYLRGYQCMNMERFREYQKEFYAAYERADYRKIGEVVQDTIQISNDTMRIIRKRRAIAARGSFIRAQAVPHNRNGTEIVPPPSNKVHALIIPRPPLVEDGVPASRPPEEPHPPPAPPAAGAAGGAGRP